MPQTIRCPHCQKQMQVPDNAGGKNVRCPHCSKPFTVPGGVPLAAVAASSPGGALPAAAVSASRPSIQLPPVPPPSVAPSGATTTCPSCGSQLPAGAVSCMDCGFMLQGDDQAEAEGPPNLCTNPACGVANPPGERTCQRCSTPLPVAAGTLLHNRYRLEKLLAMGGFGAVYKAVDIKNGNREVAIKDMIGGDPQEFQIRLNFFRREAEILRSLEQVPVVPKVHDFIYQGQTAHLVLEFIKGTDLLKLMESNGNKPFPVELVVEWGKSICDVLIHMHGQMPPIIHRDVKPDNIMLLDDQRSIKMIDFGTARDLGRTVKERMAGKTRVYTEGYAPPEQIVGKPEPRSDLFALAATLYHLVTGEAPNSFYTAGEIETKLTSPNPPWPPQHRWFYELLKINLAEDANERYFSAKEIKADLLKRAVTKESICPKCRAANKARTPYCVKCAEPLTDATSPCGSCGKGNRLGSRFCIHCGNRLR